MAVNFFTAFHKQHMPYGHKGLKSCSLTLWECFLMCGRERGIHRFLHQSFVMHLEKKIRPKAVVNNDWHSGRLIVLVISAGKLAFKMQLEIHLGDWWSMWLINLSRFRGGPALHHPLCLSSWAVRLVKSSVSEANSSEWLPFRWNGYQDPLFNVKTSKNIVFNSFLRYNTIK